MGFTMQVRPLQEAIAGDSRTVLLLLFAAVGMVLLIACANTAQFLLARSLQRQDEVAIRLSRSAPRAAGWSSSSSPKRWCSPLPAGCSGLWAAQALVRALVALIPTSDPLLAGVRADATVLALHARPLGC